MCEIVLCMLMGRDRNPPGRRPGEEMAGQRRTSETPEARGLNPSRPAFTLIGRKTSRLKQATSEEKAPAGRKTKMPEGPERHGVPRPSTERPGFEPGVQV